MALDESIDNLDKLESNGITAYIDPNLHQALEQFGPISVDYVQRPDGSGGYMIRAGNGGDCSPDKCSSCG